MYKDKTVGVVVPAYNEEKLIGRVIETMPDFVDRIIVVDDVSRDATAEIVERFVVQLGSKVVLIKHEINQGVGGAIVTGYKYAADHNIDVTAVMAGDAQMDPNELSDVVDPVVEEEVDYVKGNRLFTGEAWKIIPRYRYLGNAFLSLFTKIASGYWHVADSQTGYTAISLRALKTIQLDNIYKRYGFPNDILVHLNVYDFPVADVPVSPVYNIGEKSGIRLWKVVPTLSLLLMRRFLWRMKEKYIIRDFHPLIFFYLMGNVSFWGGFWLGVYVMYLRFATGSPFTTATVVLIALLIISGLQSLFFAMWFDMEYSKEAVEKKARHKHGKKEIIDSVTEITRN